jgi:organic hydroperoxide reductase OsmC/OhrA
VHRYEAQIAWQRGDAKFTDNRYSRGHQWSFDGGITVPASSSPNVVPTASVAAAIDPEEALVASAASCHMLWFLSLAAKQGFVVERYVDRAFGEMAKNAAGKLAFSRITLRPAIDFTPETDPTPAELAALHHAAHDECYIANSLRTEIVVEPPAKEGG